LHGDFLLISLFTNYNHLLPGLIARRLARDHVRAGIHRQGHAYAGATNYRIIASNLESWHGLDHSDGEIRQIVLERLSTAHCEFVSFAITLKIGQSHGTAIQRPSRCDLALLFATVGEVSKRSAIRIQAIAFVVHVASGVDFSFVE
jgi:hypothetical protein